MIRARVKVDRFPSWTLWSAIRQLEFKRGVYVLDGPTDVLPYPDPHTSRADTSVEVEQYSG